MVKRTIADVYALAWIASVVFLGVTMGYGVLSYFGVGGLSFHLDRVGFLSFFWVVLAFVYRYLFFKELKKQSKVNVVE